ncbi:hypothetical protein Hte_012562 [Hypoxylon texense]
MLTPAFCNIITFFYPIGYTPAALLTQDIPPGAQANILLLGSGDVRSTLFTSHVDARNVLLLSLIIDDGDKKNENAMWCIYFHMYLDEKARKLLRSQAEKLLKLSKTMDAWKQSKYGSRFGFCDSATLKDVRTMWKFYSLQQEGEELSQFERLFESALRKAMVFGEARGVSPAILDPSVNNLRSVLPASSRPIDEAAALFRHFWEHWSTELDANVRAAAKIPNPMFLTLKDDAIFHYSSDPLAGFHLATPYVSPGTGNQLLTSHNDALRQKMVVAAARKEFFEWAASYRARSPNIMVRFLIGDAVSFAHTLQHKRTTGENTAGWYRTPHRPGPLILDGPDYLSGTAPLTFDVIDTFNLCDHVGPLIILTAASPLLRNALTSTLYAEITVKYRGSRRGMQILDALVCGHAPTVSALLGLFPVDYWTNTAHLPLGDEDALNQNPSSQDPSSIEALILRTIWKRPVVGGALSGPQAGLVTLRFDPEHLAQVLYRAYITMFLEEEMKLKPANTTLGVFRVPPMVRYQRGAFASFVGFVKGRVECDWDSAMNILGRLVIGRDDIVTSNLCFQELNIYLHILGIYSTRYITEWKDHPELLYIRGDTAPPPGPVGGRYGDLRDWKDIPTVVCVTLRVPREKLQVLLDADLTTMGVLPVQCSLSGAPRPKVDAWRNNFYACQMMFGNVSTKGTRHTDSFELSVEEDDAGWRGSSALLVSFYVPTGFLVLEPRKAVVSFGIEHSAQTMAAFLSKLGIQLRVHSSTLDDYANVYLTRYAPGQAKYPTVPGFAKEDFTDANAVHPGTTFSLSAGVDMKTMQIEHMTGRFEITSQEYKETLKDCEVKTSTKSPHQVVVTLGQGPSFMLAFPVLVMQNTKLRVARKSCYVEVIARVATDTEWKKHPHFMYPVHLVDGKPTNWNMPYLKNESCPIIDPQLAKTPNCNWLVPHVGLSLSSRERALQRVASSGKFPGEDARVQFKDSIVDMFVLFSGRAIKKIRVFGLCNRNDGGNQIVVVPSAMRIDLANRTVVLDCAILPLHAKLTPKVSKLLPSSISMDYYDVWLDDAALGLWKYTLPAYVERCRTWEHRSDCEYATSGKVPLTIEHGEPFLCTCGNGKFPAKFADIAHWDALSKHAVRAAISPAYWAPYVDEVFRQSA